jgi:hypothetical protein
VDAAIVGIVDHVEVDEAVRARRGTPVQAR